MSEKRVTVLMTLFNKGKFVQEAINSVLCSTFSDFELLVVDDASTDGGPELVRSIPDGRIRILQSTVNTGRAAAANRGYEAARGEFIAILDADDIAHPQRLAKQVEFMESHPEVGIVGSAYKGMGRSQHVGKWPATDAECRAQMLFRDPVLYGSSMIRRSVLEQHGIRSNPDWKLPAEDYLFLLKIGVHAQYANLAEPLITYRLGENNMVHGRDPLADKRLLTKEVFRFFKLDITDREVELQMALHDVYDLRFSPSSVRELHGWMKKLIRMNQERGLFPVDLFEMELERRWKHLFFPIADTDLSATFVHSYLSGSWRADRLSYLAKATLKRWMVREHKPN